MIRHGFFLFVRPGNLRAMEWTELDLDAGLWRIPAGKMKMRESHVVPLATQAVAILRELQPLTVCFPAPANAEPCDERQHDQRRATPAWLRQGHDDGPRLPSDALREGVGSAPAIKRKARGTKLD
jgi:integrase